MHTRFKPQPNKLVKLFSRDALGMSPVRAALVTVPPGSDYIETVQPTFFAPLGALNPLAGLPLGPGTGTTDTIVQRKQNCALDLAVNGSNCTIDIEMVALSLVSTVNPNVRVRESPSTASLGQMTMASDGTGNGGTFDSFFDIFFDITMDNGQNWQPQGFKRVVSTQTFWTKLAIGLLLMDGSIVDFQDANTNNCPNILLTCVGFFIKFEVVEYIPIDFDALRHTGRAARAIPEPERLALVGAGLAVLVLLRRRRSFLTIA